MHSRPLTVAVDRRTLPPAVPAGFADTMDIDFSRVPAATPATPALLPYVPRPPKRTITRALREALYVLPWAAIAPLALYLATTLSH